MRRAPGMSVLAVILGASCAGQAPPHEEEATSRLAIGVAALELETLVEVEYVEASCSPADSICANFFPDLPCVSDGDGPRVDYDYTYTGTEFEFHDPIRCRYRNWNYPAMTCSYSAAATSAHSCACE